MIRRSILAAALSLQTVAALAQTTTQLPAPTPTTTTPTPPAAAPAVPARSEITLAKFQKRREKAILDLARAPGFSAAKMREALRLAREIH